MKTLLFIFLFCAQLLSAQDSTIVTYLKVGSTLMPMETPTIHDTIYYYEGGFEYDTLDQVGFTWVDGFNQVNYGQGYLVEESTLWITPFGAYSTPMRTSSQYYIVSNNRRFLFKNYVADQDDISTLLLNSKPKKRKFWQKPEYYILEIYR